jgi:hypothetical protein
MRVGPSRQRSRFARSIGARRPASTVPFPERIRSAAGPPRDPVANWPYSGIRFATSERRVPTKASSRRIALFRAMPSGAGEPSPGQVGISAPVLAGGSRLPRTGYPAPDRARTGRFGPPSFVLSPGGTQRFLANAIDCCCQVNPFGKSPENSRRPYQGGLARPERTRDSGQAGSRSACSVRVGPAQIRSSKSAWAGSSATIRPSTFRRLSNSVVYSAGHASG